MDQSSTIDEPVDASNLPETTLQTDSAVSNYWHSEASSSILDIRPTLVASTGSTYCHSVATVLNHTLPPWNRPHGTRQHTSENDYFCQGHWSSDGSLLLTSSYDRCLRVFQYPETVWNSRTSPSSEIPEPLGWEPFLCLRESEGIVDCQWYPLANGYDPSTWCVLTTTRDHPLHLWDVYTGQLRASYRTENDREEILNSYAVAFNLDGTKVCAGCDNHLLLFDVNRPGRECTRIPITPTRRSRQGQKGIISSIHFNPDKSGLYALGTFSNSVGLYDSRDHHLHYLKKPPGGSGVTQVQFSPCGYYLYVATRTKQTIYCWDIRQTGRWIYDIDRPMRTNQRIYFDMDPSGRYLATGHDSFGNVAVHALETYAGDTVPLAIEPRSTIFKSQGMVVSNAKFHPTQPHLCTLSGERSTPEIPESPLPLSKDTASCPSTSSLDNSVRIWNWNPSPLSLRYDE
ncbi:hypothetical protein IWQ62_005982 [Dispira parvispora]|uniref:Telomerase Cajal body protein 1 n=1 Tax=Dispira parvispora TaxID=1520584 RepID=A0A9W8DZ24_9FUNG|nr:hypothetical protein IWQ62_005982 [Dispira parvispora]